MRILLILILTWMAFKFFRAMKGLFRSKSNLKPSNTDKTKPQELISCATCSIFILREQAIISGGKYYCSDNCLKNKSTAV